MDIGLGVYPFDNSQVLSYRSLSYGLGKSIPRGGGVFLLKNSVKKLSNSGKTISRWSNRVIKDWN